MFAAAAVMAMTGFVWQPWCPCVKNIWTPTCVFFSGAIAYKKNTFLKV